MIERVEADDRTYAIVVRSDDAINSTAFVTPDALTQQVGVLSRDAGYEVEPHYHEPPPVDGDAERTQEVLVVRSGVVRVDLYARDGEPLGSRTLHAGDLIVLVTAAHAVEVVEDAELIEVKQGPYGGPETKVALADAESRDERRDATPTNEPDT